MLYQVSVKNLAILEDINVLFKEGMTALTGQTGAGKSLLIDSINLILGQRADTDLIRYGEKESIVKGVFKNINSKAIEVLKKYGIKYEGNLTIQRKLNINGKNTIKVNDENFTLQQLKELGLYLGDIHVQHDTYRLINKDNYLSLIDDSKDQKFMKVYNNYLLKRLNYLEALKKYQTSLKKNDDLKNKVDFLEFQKEELESLNLEKDLDITLENEVAKLSNYDKIFTNLNESYLNLDNETFNLDNLYEAFTKLEEIIDYDEEFKKSEEIIKDCYYNLSEVKSYLFKAKDSLDFDPDYLDSLNSQLYELNKIKEKYHKTNNELISYLEDITLELSLVTNFDETIKELKEDVKEKYAYLIDAAKELTAYRKKISLNLEKALIKESMSLDLKDTNFEVSFNEVNYNDPFDSSIFKDNGVDEIDFLVSFNKGEPVKPLSKVASGGELSRLMLAFKIIYLSKNNLDFMVFDEIDSGISGVTAHKIALKLSLLAKKVQVLAITHLAQVAAKADNQLYIKKVYEDERTKTLVKELNEEERITEIATMLSGMELKASFIETAKEMLEKRNLE